MEIKEVALFNPRTLEKSGGYHNEENIYNSHGSLHDADSKHRLE